MKKLVCLIMSWPFLVAFSTRAMESGNEDDRGKQRKYIASSKASSAATVQPEKENPHKSSHQWPQVTCFGLPGSGKSTTLRALSYIMNQLIGEESLSHWLNQDECGGNRKAFEGLIRTTQKSPTNLVLADKGNHQRHHRASLAAIFNQASKGQKPWLIEFSADTTDDTLIERIKQRGKGHHSIQTDVVAREVIARWRRELEPLNDQDRSEFQVISLNPGSSLEDNLRIIIEAYFQAHPSIRQQFSENPGLIEEALEAAHGHEERLRAQNSGASPQGFQGQGKEPKGKPSHSKGYAKKTYDAHSKKSHTSKIVASEAPASRILVSDAEERKNPKGKEGGQKRIVSTSDKGKASQGTSRSMRGNSFAGLEVSSGEDSDGENGDH